MKYQMTPEEQARIIFSQVNICDSYASFNKFNLWEWLKHSTKRRCKFSETCEKYMQNDELNKLGYFIVCDGYGNIACKKYWKSAISMD